MNLLVTGNGLDLDLGLPTRYTDFLDFVNAFEMCISNFANEIDEFNTKDFSKYKDFSTVTSENNCPESVVTLQKFYKSFSHQFVNKACKDFFHCIHNNFWIKYFNNRYKQHLIVGENWIDLENEIQIVITILEDKNYFEIQKDLAEPRKISDSEFFSNWINTLTNNLNIQNKILIWEHNYRNLQKHLLLDFEKFVMALGIYLDFFVAQLTPNVKGASKELQDLITTTNKEKSIDHVLSFNYINNFKINTLSKNNVCFIHGAVHYLRDLQEHLTENLQPDDKNFLQIENIIRRNKMIVGFDSLQNSNELSAEDFELEFVDYRKYFQRIYKGTDNNYIDWLNEYQIRLRNNIRTSTTPENWENLYQQRLQAQLSCNTQNKVFIFGHSLNATDNEIFKDIFLRKYDDTKITIFYHDLDARKRIITNLIKILGKPTLVEKTKGKNPTITFIAQSPAVL